LRPRAILKLQPQDNLSGAERLRESRPALLRVVAVGIRLLVMQRVQQRRERQNRQINERLKTLIAAYKTLGGSFTGNLAVDPSYLRDVTKASTRKTGEGGHGTFLPRSSM